MMNQMALLLMLVMLGGCSARVSNAPGTDVMARDTVTALKASYPPARTRLCVTKAPKDAFAKNLVTALRQQGYAVAEQCDGKTTPIASHLFTNGNRAMVSVQVNDKRFARAFNTQQETPAALGVWTRGELSHARG
ncbi:conjugal transfer protein TrbH [Legionella geestiana]|uniref:Conjugal transfer protein TrbH n=1 Tax=Legionella geestiana TaxID=45065 RepID=A0A0W0U7L7_9GAMM|nr:hypothetical protein [Legionella geestiana]KTD03686.1 conjugal transfer protein TrbH [Legionella geestiana]QBS11540.1 hypothetical protein E4T54_01630 [Legionella geestiana]STX53788.1 Putative uncharacterized protein (Precursor) [Legionella geestiana]